MAKLPTTKADISLPSVTPAVSGLLTELTSALGVPREVLASDEEIENAWANLPSILKKIDPTLRDAQIAKMCVAVATGLFDGAINFVWNASVSSLRQKVWAFGLNVVSQIRGASFKEEELLNLKDADLLSLCLELNLINLNGYFMLDQCRALRNSFSAAHPSIGVVDDQEVLSFANRCARFALGGEPVPQGVDIEGLIAALKGGRFNEDQSAHWIDSLLKTHDAQRGMVFFMLHGIYCDPDSSEDTRVNALDLSRASVETVTDEKKADVVTQHAEYVAKGDDKRAAASRLFFEKLGLLALLGDPEKHALIHQACKKLYAVHQSFDNFYNEPPFAERLYEVSRQIGVPDSVKADFVATVVMCGIGNGYGVSWSAHPYYRKMVQGFSPSEIKIMLDMADGKTLIGGRLKSNSGCQDSFKDLLKLVDASSVPSSAKPSFEKWKS